MKKRYYKLISLCLVGWMMMNGTSISYAAEVSCTEEVQEGSPTVEGVSEEHTAQTDENEETVDDIPDLVVQGTGENEIPENSGEELIIAGTEESLEPVAAPPKNVDNEILNSALVKVENYLSAAVTNPVSDTINGEWSVIAMARYGVLSEEAKNNYLANLYEELDQTDGVLDSNKYTEYSRAILALTAIGKNPSDVKGYNLLYYLADFNKVKFQGINGSIWALLALDSYQYEIPKLSAEDLEKGKIQTTREKLIQEILDREIEGGGWALGAGSGADPDITAMAVMAIAPYTHQRQDVKSAFDRGIEKLSNMQNEFGGYNRAGSGENLESAAQVITALSVVDSSLLNDDRFIKNGNSLFDYMLQYQIPADGSFCHSLDNIQTDGIATDQGAIALLSYYRAVNGQNSIYDMTDVSQEENPDSEESAENIEKLREQIAKFQQEAYISDKKQVYQLSIQLEEMKPFEEKEEFANKINGILEEIKKQENIVQNLGEKIWDELNPEIIAQEDTETVDLLMQEYMEIPEANRSYVEHSDELLRADEIIQKLKKEVLSKQIFEMMKISKKDFIYYGNDYRILLEGKQSYADLDMNAAIRFEKKDKRYDFHFIGEGQLPGEIQIQAECDFPDGEYELYLGEGEPVGKVTVSQGNMECTLEKYGDYYFEIQDESGKELIIQSTTKDNRESISNAPKTTSSGRPSSQVSSKSSSKNKIMTNIVKAHVVNNIVSQEQVNDVKGTEKNLVMEGKMGDGTTYVMTLHGKDVKEIKEIQIGLENTSKYQDEILVLSENPSFLSFAQKDNFPGVIQVETSVDLENGEYLLFYYDPQKEKAEYIQKVEVNDKKTKFLVESGGDYFIAKKAKVKSVSEIMEGDNENSEEITVDQVTADNLIIEGTKNTSRSILPYAIGVSGVIVVIAVIVIIIRKNHRVVGK